MNVPLRLCPFCGCSGILISEYSSKKKKYLVRVECTMCNASAKTFFSDLEESKTEALAIMAWNHRTIQEDENGYLN